LPAFFAAFSAFFSFGVFNGFFLSFFFCSMPFISASLVVCVVYGASFAADGVRTPPSKKHRATAQSTGAIVPPAAGIGEIQ
jgi:hypothetical protein